MALTHFGRSIHTAGSLSAFVIDSQKAGSQETVFDVTVPALGAATVPLGVSMDSARALVMYVTGAAVHLYTFDAASVQLDSALMGDGDWLDWRDLAGSDVSAPLSDDAVSLVFSNATGTDARVRGAVMF